MVLSTIMDTMKAHMTHYDAMTEGCFHMDDLAAPARMEYALLPDQRDAAELVDVVWHFIGGEPADGVVAAWRRCARLATESSRCGRCT